MQLKRDWKPLSDSPYAGGILDKADFPNNLTQPVGGLSDLLGIRLLYATAALLTILLGLVAATLPGLRTAQKARASSAQADEWGLGAAARGTP